MPAFKDGPIKTEADLRQGLYNEPKSTYYKREAELRTSRNELLDISSGVAITGLTLLLFALRKRIHTVAHVMQLRTLCKPQVFIWFNVGWIVLFGALHWYYLYRGARGDYPPFADSIAIPLYYGQAALLVCWPVLNMLLLLAIWPAKMGGYLFVKPLIYTWWVLLIEVFHGIWLVLAALYLLISIIDGDHLTVPVIMLFLYLLLVLRAGHVEAINARINKSRLSEEH
ncbi:hypothetical protein ACFPAF_07365 [Hymenobacter endophyticus]|uniref:DUF4328 domain-containing protein n=1 Tax=Hymenobacter endophyticus TaxID=3076335 RepID=A0ABU3TFR4_9BACT|nr:hypothetical protein [Hymenobacter endophyticus]MDU0370203.1 hypothetical protein [Hymenobacter endophyticus]